MPEFKPLRPGELKIELPPEIDAGLQFIGVIRTPWPTPSDCPKNSAERKDVEAKIEVSPLFAPGLKDIALFDHLIALYCLTSHDVI